MGKRGNCTDGETDLGIPGEKSKAKDRKGTYRPWGSSLHTLLLTPNAHEKRSPYSSPGPRLWPLGWGLTLTLVRTSGWG